MTLPCVLLARFLQFDQPMDLIIIVLVCAIVGFLVWLITTNIPMPPGWAIVLQVLALALLLFWLIPQFVTLPNVLTHR